jgi:hypothetical protein
MSRFIIAISGEVFVGIKGWEVFPTDKRKAYRFTEEEGAHFFAVNHFYDYAVVEVPK